MKFLVGVVAIIALCRGSAIPVIPGDNSHYVEGESRYIWMPDGDGVPHLVDLHEPADSELFDDPSRNGANNAYWLFTRNNPDNAQILIHGNANSVLNSNYASWKPLKVLVHGWRGSGTSQMNPLITSAFLDLGDVNVIVVDWRSAASSVNYWQPVRNVPPVGQYLGNFLSWLVDLTGSSWNDVHLIGYSLGAHVIGNAGRHTAGKPVRITGLDPAGPQWGGNSNALRGDDGAYVECIHTCGGTIGINDPICAANFYPNGGQHRQPGCGLLDYSCSHGRAYQFFAASVRLNHLIGQECSDLREANRNRCSGSSLYMGNSNLSKRGYGFYAMSTGSSWPF